MIAIVIRANETPTIRETHSLTVSNCRAVLNARSCSTVITGTN